MIVSPSTALGKAKPTSILLPGWTTAPFTAGPTVWAYRRKAPVAWRDGFGCQWLDHAGAYCKVKLHSTSLLLQQAVGPDRPGQVRAMMLGTGHWSLLWTLGHVAAGNQLLSN